LLYSKAMPTFPPQFPTSDGSWTAVAGAEVGDGDDGSGAVLPQPVAANAPNSVRSALMRVIRRRAAPMTLAAVQLKYRTNTGFTPRGRRSRTVIETSCGCFRQLQNVFSEPQTH
jgi:hypothetical protein